MKIRISALLVAFLLVAPALFVVGTSRAQNPVYYSVEPIATPPLIDTNSSLNGLETNSTPSPVGQNFTMEIHLIGATTDNVPLGILGAEVHLYFGNILAYAVPTGFTDFLGQTGGVLMSPVVETLGGFYASNGTKYSVAPYTGAVEFELAGASEGAAWSGADGLVAKVTFEIIKQPNATKGESTVSFPLELDFTDLYDPNVNPVNHDSISGTLTIDSTGGSAPPPPSQYTLKVNVSGNGTVTQNPSSATYASGTNVTLTATPDANWTFQGWGGDLTGSQSPVNITMNGNKTVVATFIQQLAPGQGFTLTVIIVGNGTVTANPPNATYTSGAIVTLTANATTSNSTLVDNWYLNSWSGDLTGALNPATITMDANKTVTATFAKLGDFNNGGKVGLADLTKFATWWNMNSTNPLWNVATSPWAAPSAADFDHNGKINLVDLITLAILYSH